MRLSLKNPKVKFYIGDVRNYNSINDAMRGVDAESLRDSDSLREQTKRKVDNILSKFDL